MEAACKAVVFFRIFNKETEQLLWKELYFDLENMLQSMFQKSQQLIREEEQLNHEIFEWKIRQSKAEEKGASELEEQEYNRKIRKNSEKFQELQKEYQDLNLCKSELKKIKKLAERRKIYSTEKSCAEKFWFASFSDQSIQGIFDCAGRNYAGSLYFDDGRIRLVHSGGPLVVERNYLRTFGSEILNKRDWKTTVERVKSQQNQSTGEPMRLIEYRSESAISKKESSHESRGIPGEVSLSDDEIGQLYYIAKQVTLYNSPIAQNTGNKIILDYFRLNRSLGSRLGYI